MTYEIYINGEISEWALKDWATGQLFLQSQLNEAIDKATGRDTIQINLNSVGGDVFTGFEIYNLIQKAQSQTQATIEIINTAFAASIASVIFTAGKKSKMFKNSFVMIHNPFAFVGGDSEELKRTAETLEKMRDNIAQAYVDKVMRKNGGNDKKLKAEFLDLMQKETYLTAEECLKLGLADEIIDYNAADIERVRIEGEAKAASLLEFNQSLQGVDAPAQNAAVRTAYQNVAKNMQAFAQKATTETKKESKGLLALAKTFFNGLMHNLGMKPKDLADELTAEAVTDEQPEVEQPAQIETAKDEPIDNQTKENEMTKEEEIQALIDASVASVKAENEALKKQIAEKETAEAQAKAAQLEAQNKTAQLQAQLASGAPVVTQNQSAQKEAMIKAYMNKTGKPYDAAARAVEMELNIQNAYKEFSKNKNA